MNTKSLIQSRIVEHIEPTAIIGMGCLFPKADSPNAYWSNIVNRVDAITEIPPSHWDAADFQAGGPVPKEFLSASRGGFIPLVNFDPFEFNIPPNALEAIDTSQLLGLMVAKQALNDAGYGPDHPFDHSHTSVMMGVTGTLKLVIPLGARLTHPIWKRCLKQVGISDQQAEAATKAFVDSFVAWQENSFPGLLGNVVAGRIAKHFNLGGTNCVVDAACASSLAAIHMAMMELNSGRADLIVTGGIDTFNDVFMYTCFDQTHALSPKGQARPFDNQANGTVLGEGLGVLILKRLKDARRDNDRIYAVILGIGSATDNNQTAIYAPNPEGQILALKRAYQLASISPDTIGLIEAHGTGTKAGDAAELKALMETYSAAGAKPGQCALGSVKSQIGHTKAAAGIAGIIKATLALHHKVLPPTINVEQPTKELLDPSSPFYVSLQKRPWMPEKNHPRRAAVSAFGFGGSNFHCVLEEVGVEKPEVAWNQAIELLAFSAETIGQLAEAFTPQLATLDWNKLKREAAVLRAKFKPEHGYRLLLAMHKDVTNLEQILTSARQRLINDTITNAWQLQGSVFFGSGKPPGKLGMLFPGQGSQYLHMLSDLTCVFPVMHQNLAIADQIFGDTTAGNNSLADIIYPRPVFSKKELAEQEAVLRDTERAQPALGAVSLGAFNLLEWFGLQAEAFGGHSFGELTALAAARRIDRNDLFKLAIKRGSLMAAGGDDKGAMLAVQASVAELKAIAPLEKLQLVIANRNSPRQNVLSGPTQAIESAARVLEQQGIITRRLQVSAAFHSPIVGHVQAQFRKEADQVVFNFGVAPVFSNLTASLYPEDDKESRQLLAAQLASPVEFMQEIENMYHFGVRTFLETGPGSRLTGLVKSILADHPHTALSLDASSGNRHGLLDLALTLAHLSSLGYQLNLSLWNRAERRQANDCPDREENQCSKATIQLCGANHMNPSKKISEPEFVTHSAAVNSARNHGIQNPEDTPAFTPAAVQTSVAMPTPKESANRNSLSLLDALQLTRETMETLQRFQEQTARLHQQFLKGQESVQQTFNGLVEQQQQLLRSSLGLSGRTAEKIVSAAINMPEKATQTITTNLFQERLSSVPESVTPNQLATETDNARSKDPIPVSNQNLPNQLLSATTTDIGKGLDAATRVRTVLLDVISEKTGYPQEMLEMEMEMDADLGIDSIKRVEIFSALQEKLPEAPQVDQDRLGNLKTLAQIVAFLAGVEPSNQLDPVPEMNHLLPPTPTEAILFLSSEEHEESGVERLVLTCRQLAENEVPPTFLLPTKNPIWITRDDSGLAEALRQKLSALRYTVQLIDPHDWKRIELPVALGGLIIISPRKSISDTTLKDCFKILKKAGPPLMHSGKTGAAVLVTVSRLDGQFGLGTKNPKFDPIGGGLAGLLKTAHREWPEVHCTALDLAGDIASNKGADFICRQMFRCDPIEVGFSAKGMISLELEPVSLKGSTPGSGAIPLSRMDLVIISGGARGITAEVALMFAERFQSNLVLLGRSKNPIPEPQELACLTLESHVKRWIMNRSQNKLSPKQLAEQYRELMTNRELLRNLERIQATGVQVSYYSVDIRDAIKVQNLINEIRKTSGPVRGLIHGAGVLADSLIVDKTEAQFERVYATKVDGIRNLLKNLDPSELRVMVLFSSSTGRYGRSGQSDYAAANEVLNKMAQQQSRLLPDCRVVAVNWGPWDGGMVTSAHKKLFLREGVGLIDFKTGANYLEQELRSSSQGPVEIVILGKQPIQLEPEQATTLPDPSLGSSWSTAFEFDLGDEQFPFLRSYMMKGQQVLPLSVIIEWLALAALHGNPGLKFCGFDNLKIVKGLSLNVGTSQPIAILATKFEKEGRFKIVPVKLVSRDTTTKHEVVHAQAGIVLSTDYPQASKPFNAKIGGLYSASRKDIYTSGRLFHGQHFQGLEQITGCMADGIAAAVRNALAPAAWIRHPLRSDWITDPLVLDSSFQMMTIWSFELKGLGSLPTAAGRFRQFRLCFPTGPIQVLINIAKTIGQRILATIEYIDSTTGNLIARMEDFECVMDHSLNTVFPGDPLPHAKKLDGMDSIVN